MVDAEHCGRYEPGNPEGGADHDEQRHEQEVQVVAAALEQLVLFPVVELAKVYQFSLGIL